MTMTKKEKIEVTMKITVRGSIFHNQNSEIFYQGMSEAQAIKAARKHRCTACQCGGPQIIREDGKKLYRWEPCAPFVERGVDDEPFWDY